MILHRFLSQQPKFLLVILALILLGFIGFLDFQVPEEIVLSIYYLMPITLVTWFVGRGFGFLFSLGSAATIFLINNPESCSGSTLPFVRHWNAAVALLLFLIVSATLAELHSALMRENKLSRTDGLTGISNRRDFLDIAKRVVADATRYRQPLTIAYIDVDNFKDLNDNFGHRYGDQVLQAIARELKASLRATDGAGRLGGDEFAILLPRVSYEPAIGVINRVHQSLTQAMKKQQFQVTFSIGVVSFNSPPISVDVLIETADSLMYEAKRKGKDRIEHTVVE
ncbi:MAG: GGDEF domain-containing protein [Pseudanabaenaceae cyanobacterium bins.68]|nr:GGDEF domain-containing protein [Pseudanabaenaceae cyanobacterium bins.68]